MDLSPYLLELVRLAATDLPADVETALEGGLANEAPCTPAHEAMTAILDNVELARQTSRPICQDTGTPHFYIYAPPNTDLFSLKAQIRAAVIEATGRAYLRPNAVDLMSGKNSGDNSGDAHYPAFHFLESAGQDLEIVLVLKGGGCENVGAQYALPDTKLGALRDLDGVRRVVLDAAVKAQGRGCAPGFLGVAIGGDRGAGYQASKEAFIPLIGTRNPDAPLAALEDRLKDEINRLDIGPMGFGGKTGILGVRIEPIYSIPASYFVTVSYMCWAYRRRKMIVSGNRIYFE